MTWLGPMHQAKRHAKRARWHRDYGADQSEAVEWYKCLQWLLSALFAGELPERQVFPPDSAYGPLR